MRLLLLIAALCVGLSLALAAGKKLPKLSPAERERYFIICIKLSSRAHRVCRAIETAPHSIGRCSTRHLCPLTPP